MNIIEAKSTYLETEGLTPYQFMEKAGRTCYKSEKNITADSAIKFVQGLKKSGHTAMLEHSHIILKVNSYIAMPFISTLSFNDTIFDGTKVKVLDYLNISNCYNRYIISGSFRAFLALWNNEIVDNAYIGAVKKRLHNEYPEVFDDFTNIDVSDYIDDVNVITRKEFIDFANKQYTGENLNKLISRHLTHTVVFTCDRGVSHEFVRHRVASFAQESSRYCKYSNDKYGNEITVIKPCFFEEGSEQYKVWYDGCKASEDAYLKLIELGCKAEEARDNLPTSTKTELIVTATENEWQHILNLRYHGTTGTPHPQIVQSMSLVYDELVSHSDHRLS